MRYLTFEESNFTKDRTLKQIELELVVFVKFAHTRKAPW